jgi:hypothetical protein
VQNVPIAVAGILPKLADVRTTDARCGVSVMVATQKLKRNSAVRL